MTSLVLWTLWTACCACGVWAARQGTYQRPKVWLMWLINPGLPALPCHDATAYLCRRTGVASSRQHIVTHSEASRQRGRRLDLSLNSFDSKRGKCMSECIYTYLKEKRLVVITVLQVHHSHMLVHVTAYPARSPETDRIPCNFALDRSYATTRASHLQYLSRYFVTTMPKLERAALAARRTWTRHT